jgi:urease subunit beta
MSTTNSKPDKNNLSPGFTPATAVAVGGVITAKGDIEYNCGRPTVTLRVRNTGDRAIQVGSHFHFFEVNRYMEFNRAKAFGCHLNIPATTAMRFEPGEEKSVELVPFAGKQRIIGFNGLTQGFCGKENKPSYYPCYSDALRNIKHFGFKSDAEL